jgi:hypothetical protein
VDTRVGHRQDEHHVGSSFHKEPAILRSTVYSDAVEIHAAADHHLVAIPDRAEISHASGGPARPARFRRGGAAGRADCTRSGLRVHHMRDRLNAPTSGNFNDDIYIYATKVSR